MDGSLSTRAYRRMITEGERQSRNMVLLKPGRRLGGGWIDQFVAQRRIVSLCPDCQRRYGDWQTRYHYSPRDKVEISDCDGCGQVLQTCTVYYASIM